jgi:hypothetical protein
MDDGQVTSITIKSHSAVSKMVSKCLAILNPEAGDASPPASTVLEITADAKVAGKAVTIAEIVKRRILEHGGTISQTTRAQEKSVTDTTDTDNAGRTHLQGEGYQKRQKLEAQIVIRLERTYDAVTN